MVTTMNIFIIRYKVVYIIYFCVLSSFCYLTTVAASNILAIFPVTSYSRFSYSEAVMDSLYKAGHNITFVSPFAEQLMSMKNNYTIIDSRNETIIYINNSSIDEFTEMNIREFLQLGMDLGVKYCHDIMHLKEIQDILKFPTKQFDVMFVDNFPMYQCFLFIAKMLDIPVIAVTTIRFSSGFGANGFDILDHPSYIPQMLTPFGSKMSFYERLINSWYYIQIKHFEYFEIIPKLEKFRSTYFNSIKHNDKYLSLVFQNNHFNFLTIPCFPSTVDIGGIHVKKEKPLPINLQTFLDEAEHGVILFSLGSVIKCSTMTPELTTIIKDSFAEIPQRVIWKYEGKLDNLPSNVLVTDWIPQRDILAHKNLKAFISHCGQSGTYEAIYNGVPIIATPLFGDQRSNAVLLKNLGVAVYLDNVLTMTKEDFRNALHAAINNTKYYEKMKKLSKIFKDRPMTPEQAVVYWTEYVIRHNGALHLKSSAINMPLYQYLLLDVILFLVVIIIIVIFILYHIFILVLTSCKKFLLAHYWNLKKND